MKVIRVRVASLMVFVAVVALNFAAIGVALGRSDRFNEEWLMGALPMANAVAVGLFIGYRRHRCNRFQLGFLAFGSTALGLYVGGLWLYPDMTGLHFRLFTEPHDMLLDTIHIVVWDMFPVVLVALSQVVFAIFGGFLFRNFRVH